MPVLVMGLSVLAVFLVIGGLLFAAGISERRQPHEMPAKPTSTNKVA
jgi:hypothetical protein